VLLRHSFVYLAGRIGPGLLTFLSLVLFSRLVSPAEYGIYSVVVSTAILANLAGFYWTRTSLTRFLPVEGNKCLGSVLALTLILTAASAFAALGLYATGLPLRMVLLGFLLLLGMAWGDLGLELCRARLNPIHYGLIYTTRAFLALVFGVALARWGATGLLTGTIIAHFIPFFWQLVRDGFWTHLNWDREQLRTLWRYGWPLGLTFGLAAIVNNSDRLIIAAWLGEEKAGLYAVGYDLARQSLWLLIESVNLAAFPLAVKAMEAGGPAQAIPQLRMNVSLLLAITLPATVGLALLAEPISRIFLGAAFHEVSAWLIPLIAVATALRGLRAYFDQSFQLTRKTDGQFIVGLCGAGLNLVLNFILIPRMGIAGAAWSAIIAYGLACLASVFVGKHYLPMPLPWREVWRTSLAAGLMAAVLWFWPESSSVLSFALAGIAGGTVYVLMAVLLDVSHVRSTMIPAILKRFRAPAAFLLAALLLPQDALAEQQARSSARCPQVGYYHSRRNTMQGREHDFGLKFDHVLRFQDVDKLETASLKRYLDSGYDVVLNIEFKDDHANLGDVAAGRYDDFLKKFAQEVKADGRTIWIRPLHEANGDWYNWGVYHNDSTTPADFVAAFRHVVTVMRATGAPLKFQLNLNRYNGRERKTPLAEFHPGDEYVDMVLLTNYNRGHTDLQHPDCHSFSEDFVEPYEQVAAMTRRPLGVAEMATTHYCGDKPTWIREAMYTLATRFPRVMQITWFGLNRDVSPVGDNVPGYIWDWDINTDEEITAFREGIEFLRRTRGCR